jgi:CheY-like chemotaxis protein
MVIDDDSVYQYTVKRNVERNSLADRMLFFRDSEVALNYLSEHKASALDLPDVILLDINMPVMDGWAFLDEYEKLSRFFAKHVHLFVVTSSVYVDDVRRASVSTLVAGYLVKPIGEGELRAALDSALSD